MVKHPMLSRLWWNVSTAGGFRLLLVLTCTVGFVDYFEIKKGQLHPLPDGSLVQRIFGLDGGVVSGLAESLKEKRNVKLLFFQVCVSAVTAKWSSAGTVLIERPPH